MKNVPHWQLLMLMYFVLVAAPVMVLHFFLKRKLLANRSMTGLLIYLLILVGAAFLLNTAVMWIYYRFLFSH